MPITGRSSEPIQPMKVVFSLSGYIASPIRLMPKKTSPRPMTPAPHWRVLSRRLAKIMPNPIATKSRAYFVTLKAMIWAVIVVPMLAPMITPTDCDSDIRPALMKPTTSTVVTDDDWITAVIRAPVAAPT